MNSTIKRRLMDLIKDKLADGKNDEKFCSTWNYWVEKYEIIICEKYDEKNEEDQYFITRSNAPFDLIDDSEALATLDAILRDQTHIARTKPTVSSKEQIKTFSTIHNGANGRKIDEINRTTEFKLSNQQLVDIGNLVITELSPKIAEIGDDMQKMMEFVAYNDARVNFVLEAAHKIGLMKNREKLKKLSEEHQAATTRSGKVIRKAKKKTSTENSSKSSSKKSSKTKFTYIPQEFNKDLSKKTLEFFASLGMNPNDPNDVARFRNMMNIG